LKGKKDLIIAKTTFLALDYKKILIPFPQFKKYSSLNIQRLKNLIKKWCFCFPLHVIQCEDKYYCIDGDCRLEALYELEIEGYEIPAIPCTVLMNVKSGERESMEILKNLLLMAVSKFSEVTKPSIEKFMKSFYFDWENFSFPLGDCLEFGIPSKVKGFFDVVCDSKRKKEDVTRKKQVYVKEKMAKKEEKEKGFVF